MRPRIAVSIAARTASETSRMVLRASRLGADLAEIRLDYLRMNEPFEKIAKTEIPLIATFRLKSNGGFRSVEENRRVEMLVAAAKAGFDYVDVELETTSVKDIVYRLRAAGAKPIVSHHDFVRTPSEGELRRILRACRGLGATLPKLVTMARSLEDDLRLLNFVLEASKEDRVICFGMGKLGIQSRILSPIYGAALTYASLDEKRTVAPCQIPVSGMRRIYAEMGYS